MEGAQPPQEQGAQPLQEQPMEGAEPPQEHSSERPISAPDDVPAERDGFGMCWHPPTDMEGGQGSALLTALAVMAAYYKTLSPAITGGDSGEVMAAACSWGPAHPPGYPLFIACANVAMWLFARLGENKAYRVNLMCAIMTVVGVYNLHRAVRIISGSSAAATVGSAMYGFSPLIWNNALQAEVFSMNNMFVCLVTHILVRYLGRNDPSCHRQAYLGAFVIGLGLSNQHTLVLYAAVIVPAVFISGWRRLLRPVQFLACTILFALGMVPYSHMWWLEGCPIPWAEMGGQSLGTKYCPQFEHVPKYSWGDRRSFTGFWNHLLRKDYGTFVLAAGGADAHGKPVTLLEGLLYYLEDIAGPRLEERRIGHTKSHEGQLLYVGIPFALAGLLGAIRGRHFGRHLAACRTLVVCWVFYTVLFHSLANLPIKVPLFLAVHARFWQMPNSTLFVLVGLGFECLCRRYLDASSSPPFFTSTSTAEQARANQSANVCHSSHAPSEVREQRARDRSPGTTRCRASSTRRVDTVGEDLDDHATDTHTAAHTQTHTGAHTYATADRIVSPRTRRVADTRGGRDTEMIGIETRAAGQRSEGCGEGGRRVGRDSWRRWGLAAVLVWLQLINNYETQDQADNYAMDFLTRTAIETLPPNAIVRCCFFLV